MTNAQPVGSEDEDSFARQRFSTMMLLASYLPARRATLVDPVVALREE